MTQLIIEGQTIAKFGTKIEYFHMVLQGSAISLSLKQHELIEMEKDQTYAKYPELKSMANLGMAFQQQYELGGNKKLKAIVKQQMQKMPSEWVKRVWEQIEKLVGKTRVGKIYTFLDGPVVRYSQSSLVRRGEAITQSKKKYEQQVIAGESSLVVKMGQSKFDELIRSLEKLKQDKLVSLLMVAFSARSNESKQLMRELIRNASEKKYFPQQYVYRSEQPWNYLYVVKKGEFVMSKGFVYERGVEPGEEVVEEVGVGNYELMAMVYSLEQNQKATQLKARQRQAFNFSLGRVGPGQLVGIENLKNEVTHFNCQCVSASGKLVLVRKSDIFKYSLYDNFLKNVQARGQSKFAWLLDNFQAQLKAELTRVAQQWMKGKGPVDPDQEVLNKYSAITQEFRKTTPENFEHIVNQKRSVQKRFRQQYSSLDCMDLNDDKMQKRQYDKKFKKLLDQKGLGQSKIKGTSPFKQKPLHSPDASKDKSIKHKTALKLQQSMDRTVNPQLTSAVQEFHSVLMQESCVVYENHQDRQDKQVQYVERGDIGLVQYLVSTNKKHLRLLQHVVDKRRKKSQEQFISHQDQPIIRNYQRLMQQVTSQNLDALLKREETLKEMQSGVKVIALSHRESDYHSSTKDNESSTKFSKQFSYGAINRIKMKQGLTNRMRMQSMHQLEKQKPQQFCLSYRAKSSRSESEEFMKVLDNLNQD